MKIMAARKEIKFDIDDNGCHICTSHHMRKEGHIDIRRDGKHTQLHRLLYEQKFGNLPNNLVVRHSCDNASCINMDHLIVGTHADNVADRVSRNRSAKGIGHGRSKLTPEKVREILSDTKSSNPQLALKYGVDRTAIRKIRSGETWKEVDRRDIL
jgi:hypothetical protein